MRWPCFGLAHRSWRRARVYICRWLLVSYLEKKARPNKYRNTGTREWAGKICRQCTGTDWNLIFHRTRCSGVQIWFLFPHLRLADNSVLCRFASTQNKHFRSVSPKFLNMRQEPKTSCSRWQSRRMEDRWGYIPDIGQVKLLFDTLLRPQGQWSNSGSWRDVCRLSTCCANGLTFWVANPNTLYIS